MISSVYEDGYWWVVIDQDAWETAEIMEYQFGYPIWNTWSKRG